MKCRFPVKLSKNIGCIQTDTQSQNFKQEKRWHSGSNRHYEQAGRKFKQQEMFYRWYKSLTQTRNVTSPFAVKPTTQRSKAGHMQLAHITIYILRNALCNAIPRRICFLVGEKFSTSTEQSDRKTRKSTGRSCNRTSVFCGKVGI